MNQFFEPDLLFFLNVYHLRRHSMSYSIELLEYLADTGTEVSRLVIPAVDFAWQVKWNKL